MKHYIELRRRKLIDLANSSFLSDLSPLLRQVYFHRGIKKVCELERSVEYLVHWKYLCGVESAVTLLHDCMKKHHKIIVVGDFDVDGAVSTVLSVLCLRNMGAKVDYIIPKRFENGYGLSPEIVKQAHIRGANLILTVDNGMSSHSAVDTSYKYGIPVLITDHHLPLKTLPNATVIVNPNLGNSFPLYSLAGVGVAFYLMLALRAYLRKKKWFNSIFLKEPNLTEFLDLVALGTVSDIVPLNFNNRILVWQGLSRIRAGKCRVGITTLLNIVNYDARQLYASDLSFIIAPRLNSAGRLDDMSLSVELLLTDNIVRANIISHKLNALNKTRKKISTSMKNKVISFFENIQDNDINVPLGFTFYAPDWHQGIVGILASWFVNRFQRPVIAFAPAENGILKGSGRSILGFDLYNFLEELNRLFPDLIIKFGGHAMAVGLSIDSVKYDVFHFNFASLVNKKLKKKNLRNIILSDGELNAKDFSLQTAKMLHEAGPWGSEFPEPIFDGHFIILDQKLICNEHLKIMVKPLKGGPILSGIIFNIDTSIWPNINVHQVEMAYKLKISNHYYNQKIQLIVDYIRPL